MEVCPPKMGNLNPELHHPKIKHLDLVCLNSGLTHSCDIEGVTATVIGCDNFPGLRHLEKSAIFAFSSCCGTCQSLVLPYEEKL